MTSKNINNMKSDEVLWPGSSTFDVAHDTSFCPDHQTRVDTYTLIFMEALQSTCIIMVIGTRARAITNFLYECWGIYHHYSNHLGRWQPLVEQLALIIDHIDYVNPTTYALIDVWHCQCIIPQCHMSVYYTIVGTAVCWCKITSYNKDQLGGNFSAMELDSHHSSFFLIIFFSEWQFILLSRGENPRKYHPTFYLAPSLEKL